jgi:hypothetical protein
MAMTHLNCETLGELDGGISRAIIDAALVAMIKDLDDRGRDEKARSVVITLTAVNKQGIVAIDVQAQAKLPPYRSNLTASALRQEKTSAGMQTNLYFQEDNPENPDQPTLPGMAEGEVEND